MTTKVQFCTLHKIGFSTDLDPICPQCSLARIVPFRSVDFDIVLQKPLDAAGKPVEPAAIVPTPF